MRVLVKLELYTDSNIRTFAPNGLRLLYAGTAGDGRRVLMLATHNARILKRLTVPQRDVREPAWSPYRN